MQEIIKICNFSIKRISFYHKNDTLCYAFIVIKQCVGFKNKNWILFFILLFVASHKLICFLLKIIMIIIKFILVIGFSILISNRKFHQLPLKDRLFELIKLIINNNKLTTGYQLRLNKVFMSSFSNYR